MWQVDAVNRSKNVVEIEVFYYSAIFIKHQYFNCYLKTFLTHLLLFAWWILQYCHKSYHQILLHSFHFLNI